MRTKTLIKRFIKNSFLVTIFPLYLLFKGLSLISSPDASFRSFSQFLSLIPGKTGVFFRAAFYHLACTNTSDEISIGFLTILSHQDTTIESGVYIGPQCNIGKCSIGKNTLIGSGVHILSGNRQHEFSDPDTPIQDQGGTYEKIIIGEDCWIGNQSLVVKSIGDKSIVAAASLVLQEMPSMSIVGGHPAKILRYR